MTAAVPTGYKITIGFFFVLALVLAFVPGLNHDLFVILNSWASPATAALWANLTNLGDGLLAICIGVAIFSRLPKSLAAMFASVIIVGIVIQLAKYGFNYIPGLDAYGARPVGRLGLEAVNVIGPKVEYYSFPSGHTAAVATLATIIFLKIPSTTFKLLFMPLAIIVGLSRCVVGAHWPLDLAGGAMLGIIGGLVGVFLVDRVFIEPGYKRRIAIYLLSIVCCIALYSNDKGFDDYFGVDIIEYLVATVALLLSLYRLVETTYRRFRLSIKIKDLSRHEMVISFIKFGAVGASGFIVDLTVFTLLHNVIGAGSSVARIIAYWVAATSNWFFNRTFTFAEADKADRTLQWGKYLAMCVVSFFPNWGTFYILTTTTEFFAQYTQLALVAGVAAGMMFNFTGARLVIFKKKVEDA